MSEEMLAFWRLKAFFDRLGVEALAYDAATGTHYAVGFTDSGVPYRAYPIDSRYWSEVSIPEGYSFAS